MRKRTVKNLCKEIFWHIVYFLPIVIALFSMLLFTTENYASYVISSQGEVITEDNVTDLTGTTWIFDEVLTFDDNSSYHSYTFYINFETDGEFFDTIIWGYDLFASGGNQLVYNGVDYGEVVAYNTLDSVVWASDGYRELYITGGDDVHSFALIDFLRLNATMEEKTISSIGSVYGLMSDALNSSFDVMGLNFENDYLYNALKQVFVNGQILAVFKDVSVLLKFATYYFYVHIIHLFIDALLFIPKLAHKWIDSLTRCE